MAKITWVNREDIELKEKQLKEKMDKIADYKLRLRDKKIKVEDRLEMLIELYLGQEK